MNEDILIYIYYCDKCGWIGAEPKELAGYLWDYEMHDSCPDCWEDEVEDNQVDYIYLGMYDYYEG